MCVFVCVCVCVCVVVGGGGGGLTLMQVGADPNFRKLSNLCEL